jgi:hypothetical protein
MAIYTISHNISIFSDYYQIIRPYYANISTITFHIILTYLLNAPATSPIVGAIPCGCPIIRVNFGDVSPIAPLLFLILRIQVSDPFIFTIVNPAREARFDWRASRVKSLSAFIDRAEAMCKISRDRDPVFPV